MYTVEKLKVTGTGKLELIRTIVITDEQYIEFWNIWAQQSHDCSFFCYCFYQDGTLKGQTYQANPHLFD
jgi:hypothetical protein